MNIRSICNSICNRGRYILPALIVVSLGAGCMGIDVPYRIVENFPIEIRLGEEPLRALDGCLGIYDVGMAGSYLICSERKTEFFFSVYNSDFLRVCRFARHGRGPGEYIAPVYCGQYEDEGAVLTVSIYDRATRYFDRIAVDTDSGSCQPISHFSIPLSGDLEPRVLFRYSATHVGGVSDYRDCRYFYSDTTFRQPRIAEPVLSFGANREVHTIAQSCCAVKPDNTRIAVAFFNLPQIDIRATTGEVIKTIFIREILHPDEIDIAEAADYFLKADADDTYIYALFENPDSGITGSNSILVFDWEGNPVGKYDIARASSFAIDKRRNKIIAINMDQTQSLCSLYSLPG